MKTRIGMILALAWLAPGWVSAADLVITSFTGNGTVEWTYPTAGLQGYRIEWAANLATDKWTDLKDSLGYLAATGSTMTAEVPMFYRIKAMGSPPNGMVYIPAGTFRMGDPSGQGNADELPVHNVYVSGFYMDRYEVTKIWWDVVANWAAVNGYDITTNSAAGKGISHPVHTVTWYEAVKWCNARSQMEGLTPCYNNSAPPYHVPYKTGILDISNTWVRWTADGYRLPTEAEWEKAARGGASGYRFPWADDTINRNRANYYDPNDGGFHPDYQTGGQPYTSPVGAFTANGYGLYDMAGNMSEWCWDWYSNGYYSVSAAIDPQGPASGSCRVLRDGTWSDQGYFMRCAIRYGLASPTGEDWWKGFRCVRRP